MRSWIAAGGLLVLSGFAGLAEELPIVSIEAGQDVLEAEAAQILRVQVQRDWTWTSVIVTLDPELRAQLQRLTEGHVDEEIVIRVCGKVVSRPTLRGPVRDGVFAIRGDGRTEAERLAQVLQAKGCSEAPSV